MGLKVHSLGELPPDVERGYYLYLLDYGWKEPIAKSLWQNRGKIAELASKNNAVVISGFDGCEFSNEVLSWHNVNGVDGDDVLPAILITSCNPHKFASLNKFPKHLHSSSKGSKFSDRLVLVSLKDFCQRDTDVISLLQKIFSDISSNKKLTDFVVYQEIQADGRRTLVDAMILQPNFAGIGVDIKVIASFLKSGFSKMRGKIPNK